MIRDLRAAALAWLAYAAFFGAFFWRSLMSGYYIAPSDSLDFGVAAYLSPVMLWTQAMYSGYPIAADPQSLTWYPLLHAFRALGLDWNLFLISAYSIACTTCFLFVRRLTGSTLAGAFAGFTYGFSGVMLAHIIHFNQIHAAAWVPLALYGLQVTREGHYRSGTAAAAVGFALMWLAGHPQVPLYTAYLSAALIVGQLLTDRPAKDVRIARVAWSFGAIALGTALAAVTVIPMIELGGLSGRAEANWELYVSKALPPRQLLSLVVPFAFGGFWHDDSVSVPYFGEGAPPENTGYVGLLPVALLIAALLAASRYRREIWLWCALLVVATLLCLGDATPLGWLFYYAPGYSRFRVPARHLFVTSLCLAVIAALALDELRRRRDGWTTIGTASVAVCVLAMLAFAGLAARASDVAAALDDATYAWWVPGWTVAITLVVAAGAFLVRLVGRSPAFLLVCSGLFVALHVADLATFHYRNQGTRLGYADIPRAEAVPHPRVVELREELHRTGERVLAADGSKNPFLLPNLTRIWNLPAASGSGSLSLERYSQLLGMGGPGDVYPETLSLHHRGLDLLSIRYTMLRTNEPLAEELSKQPSRWSVVERLQYYENDRDTAYTLFRNERALPRGWCVSSVVQLTPQEAIEAIRTSTIPGGRGEFRPESIALVEDARLNGVGASPTSPPAQVIAQPDRGQFLVTSSAPCVLVLGEVYYPWWRASVDDAAADVVRVNYAMVGIAVPAGSHVVRLWLNPVSVWVGGTISVVAAILWMGIVIAGARRAGSTGRLPRVPAAAAV